MLDKLHKMLEFGELTPYVYKHCIKRIGALPKNLQDQMLNEASVMSTIGVNSEDDHKHFMYITMHLRPVAGEISGRSLSEKELSSLSSLVYHNRHINTIDTIYGFYKAVRKAMENIDLPIKKIAYPIGFNSQLAEQPRDVGKWMHTMREIYARVHRGMGYEQAFNLATANWDIMEKQDFKAWQRFYAENAQNKYKTAGDYYQAEDGSPLLPLRSLKSNIPGMPNMSMYDLPQDIEEEKQRKRDEESAKMEARKQLIEENRKKLISRLTSAERLVTDHNTREDFNGAIDMGLDKWLEMLHKLKRSIQTAPIKSAQSSTLYDMIVKRANQLQYEGYIKSGQLLETLAQEAPKAPPVTELDAPENNPGDELIQNTEQEEEDGAMDDFVRMLNHEHLDDSSLDDEIDLVVDENDLVVEAQVAPEEIPMDELVGEQGLEVEEPPRQSDTLDQVLEGITIEDVIERLELVANIIQNREIPRQLSFVDMQMGKLGIATFFPNLGEAIRSALESHQYIYTRIEDIIAKLRGSVQPEQALELTTDEESEEATSETMESVRRNLTEAEQVEKERSEARRAKREAKETGEVAPPAPPVTPEEIAGPVEVETAPPARVT